MLSIRYAAAVTTPLSKPPPVALPCSFLRRTFLCAEAVELRIVLLRLHRHKLPKHETPAGTDFSIFSLVSSRAAMCLYGRRRYFEHKYRLVELIARKFHQWKPGD